MNSTTCPKPKRAKSSCLKRIACRLLTHKKELSAIIRGACPELLQRIICSAPVGANYTFDVLSFQRFPNLFLSDAYIIRTSDTLYKNATACQIYIWYNTDFVGSSLGLRNYDARARDSAVPRPA